jgi:hypothetical protein
MHIRIPIAVLALALAGPAYADNSEDRHGPIAESFLSGLVNEQDVALVFDYLRESMSATLQGQEPPPPSDRLVRRAEVLQEEAARRGAVAARALLDEIERSIRESLRERDRRLAPSSPVQRSRI